MKSHIIICLEPLPLDERTVGLCGAEIIHPFPEMWVDLAERGLPEWDSLRDCAKCCELAESEPMLRFRQKAEKVYLYVVSEAQEAQYALVEGQEAKGC